MINQMRYIELTPFMTVNGLQAVVLCRTCGTFVPVGISVTTLKYEIVDAVVLHDLKHQEAGE